MAIVKMAKFNLIAFKSQKDKLLKQFQKFKDIEFNDLFTENFILYEDENDSKLINKIENLDEINVLDDQVSKVESALKQLFKYKSNDNLLVKLIKGNENYTFDSLVEKFHSYDWVKVSNKINNLSSKYDDITSQISKINGKIDELNKWKNLDIPPQKIYDLKYINTKFGSIPHKLFSNFAKNIKEIDYTFYEVVKITKEDYYFVISYYNDSEIEEKVENVLRNNGFSIFDFDLEVTPSEKINVFKEEKENLKKDRKKIVEEIKTYIVELNDLKAVYEYLKHKRLRIKTVEKFGKTKNTCIINGWVPQEKIVELEKVIQSVVDDEYYFSYEEAKRDDSTVPIKLKNGKITSTFENLVSTYSYPQYNEIDPTPFIVPFYITFFGMMGADAGYGLVLLIGTFIALKFFNLSKKMRKSIEFFFYLSFSVIIWGLIYGSYFGASWFKGLIDPAKDYNTVLVGSILFGIVHIYLALGLKAYVLIKNNKPWDAVFDVLFWYLALTGVMLYLGGGMLGLSSLVKNISGIVSIVGMIGIVLTGGRDAEGIGGKFGWGVYSLYGMSGYIGDFVSYSRLMALGLSGGFIAQSINMIAGMVGGSFIGLLFVPIILIFGHGFNIFLSFLGSYVHSSRLMYVEFFGKFYEGGAKQFKEFREDDKYINLD